MRTTQLSSVLCISSADTLLDSGDLSLMVSFQQDSVEELTKVTEQIDKVCSEQMLGLVQHVMLLGGLRCVFVSIRCWIANMRRLAQLHSTESTEAMLKTLKKGTHEQLAALGATNREWHNNHVTASNDLEKLRSALCAAKESETQAEAEVHSSLAAGMECVKLLVSLQAELRELRVSFAASENTASQLRERCTAAEEQVSRVSRSL